MRISIALLLLAAVLPCLVAGETSTTNLPSRAVTPEVMVSSILDRIAAQNAALVRTSNEQAAQLEQMGH